MGSHVGAFAADTGEGKQHDAAYQRAPPLQPSASVVPPVMKRMRDEHAERSEHRGGGADGSMCRRLHQCVDEIAHAPAMTMASQATPPPNTRPAIKPNTAP